MRERKLSPQQLASFREYLVREEKSAAAIEKYPRDANTFLAYAVGREITKELTVAYKNKLGKLFARTIYGIEKDIAKLADILGHSSINTTRIYIMTTGTEHRRQIERLGLVV